MPITSALRRRSEDGGRDRRATRRGSAPRSTRSSGATRVPLDGDSLRMRASETNLGDLVADAMRADAGTDIAIMNSGSIRGDRVYPAGPLTRRTLLEMHPFGNVDLQARGAGTRACSRR